ncbi:MAG TPA: LacI family DNA-binding transcriptional regulator [Spirochaetales bacterium]|nr:LacI family DNA-binding transcriptional regulator [Spirochaetales bacterium]HRY54189.1 LacI family DNA-binding transcriptional regulator [Spirochaetia bacterium]HRZ64837.1 LacI family DNA-binding transcriptional regulator [Spirochaetia bacterium]
MSIRKIAEMTGLSTATVSHAINGTRAVSSESKQKVLAAAAAIGYRPNIAAKFLRNNRSKTVALITPGVRPGMPSNYFYMDVMAGVHARLNEDEYSLIITTYEEPMEESRSFSFGVLEKQWCDGLLVVPNASEPSCIEQILKSELPYVLIDRKIDRFPCDYVISDNEKGSYEAVRLMYERGRRRIAFVGSQLRTSASHDRYLGYRRCLAERGLPEDRSLVLLNGSLSIEEGMRSGALLAQAGADAVFVSDNILTIGVFRYLKGAGRRIPEDISLIGYDDYEWMSDVRPGISSVKQRPYEMGYRAAALLLERLGDPGRAEGRACTLDTVLVLRGSH